MCLDMLKAWWLALLNSNTVLLDGLLNVIEGNTIDSVVPCDDLYAMHVSLHQVMMRSTLQPLLLFFSIDGLIQTMSSSPKAASMRSSPWRSWIHSTGTPSTAESATLLVDQAR